MTPADLSHLPTNIYLRLYPAKCSTRARAPNAEESSAGNEASGGSEADGRENRGMRVGSHVVS